MRVFPICLREDALNHPGAAAEAMVTRGDWQFREVTLCLRHNHLLVPLWLAENRYARYDFAQRFKEIEARLRPIFSLEPAIVCFARRPLMTYAWTDDLRPAKTRLGWQTTAYILPRPFAGSLVWSLCDWGTALSRLTS